MDVSTSTTTDLSNIQTTESVVWTTARID